MLLSPHRPAKEAPLSMPGLIMAAGVHLRGAHASWCLFWGFLCLMCGSENSSADAKMVAAKVRGIVSYMANTSGRATLNAFCIPERFLQILSLTFHSLSLYLCSRLNKHYGLNGHEFGQTPRDNRGQRSLTCCSPGPGGGGQRVEHDTATEQQ